MGQVCKGLCTAKYHARPAVGNSSKKVHWKKCSICSVRIKWEGNWCPCCGAPLSSRTKCKPAIVIRVQ